MSFVEKKGNERKRAMFEITGYQTRDSKQSSHIVRTLQTVLDAKQVRLAEFEAAVQANLQTIAAYE